MARILRDDSMDKARLELIGKVTIYTFLVVMMITLVLCFFTRNRGNCSFAVWQNITYLQLIRWFGLLRIDNESEFESFFKEFSLIFRPFRLPSVCLDESIDSQSYGTMQIESNGFINNAKEILILYIAMITFCSIVLISNKMSKGRRFPGLTQQVKYSIIIRLHLLLFLDFMTFSMINIAYFSSGNTCSTVNLGLSIFFLILGGFWIIQIPLLIKKKLANNLNENHDALFISIGTIVHEFKPTYRTVTYQYYTIFLLYRISLAFCLVVLSRSPSVQLFMIASFQIMTSKIYLVVYIFKVKPYIKKSDTISVFVTELLSLFLVIFIGIRSLSLGPNSKYYVTIFCVFLIWLSEAVIVARFYFAVREKSEAQTQAAALDETSPQIVTEHVPQNSVMGLKEEPGPPRGKSGLNSYFTKENSSRKVNDVFVDIGPTRTGGSSELGTGPVSNRRFELNKFTVKSEIRKNSQISSDLGINPQNRNPNYYETTGNFSNAGTKDIKGKFKFNDGN
jgi:hypothetical protein